MLVLETIRAGFKIPDLKLIETLYHIAGIALYLLGDMENSFTAFSKL